jgi:hypothetical protein
MGAAIHDRRALVLGEASYGENTAGFQYRTAASHLSPNPKCQKGGSGLRYNRQIKIARNMHLKNISIDARCMDKQ